MRNLGYDPAALDRYITGNYGEDQFPDEWRCVKCEVRINDYTCHEELTEYCIDCGNQTQSKEEEE